MMSEDARKVQANRILVTAASVVILISGLKLAQDFFVPVLLAAFIATIVSPSLRGFDVTACLVFSLF